MTRIDAEAAAPESLVDVYTKRVEAFIDSVLPPADRVPERLHSAMRYAALSGGKRVRPLLVYATGECLSVDPARCDIAAASVELIHAFSLVHDDLPAMDDDDLRRGQPTVHRKYDEATAILAADALQPLAFHIITSAEQISDNESRKLVNLISGACGSLGMTGGQAIDLQSEGRDLSVDELAHLHGLKTGALISASVMSACCLASSLSSDDYEAMLRFSRDIGLAFQIRDDILDVEGETDVIGKPAGSDAALSKATWPSLFGLEESHRRCDALLESAMQALTSFGAAADSLRYVARLAVDRNR